MILQISDISKGTILSMPPVITDSGSGVITEESLREAARIAAEISLDGYEDDPDVVTACYLCHGQCSNFGVHGKTVRPCAKGVTSILARHRQARLSRGGEGPASVAT